MTQAKRDEVEAYADQHSAEFDAVCRKGVVAVFDNMKENLSATIRELKPLIDGAPDQKAAITMAQAAVCAFLCPLVANFAATLSTFAGPEMAASMLIPALREGLAISLRGENIAAPGSVRAPGSSSVN